MSDRYVNKIKHVLYLKLLESLKFGSHSAKCIIMRRTTVLLYISTLPRISTAQLLSPKTKLNSKRISQYYSKSPEAERSQGSLELQYHLQEAESPDL